MILVILTWNKDLKAIKATDQWNYRKGNNNRLLEFYLWCYKNYVRDGKDYQIFKITIMPVFIIGYG